MRKNKKGGFVMSWVVTVFTIFFLILVFFIFFFLISLDKNKIHQEIQTETQENQIHINLLNFLRTPVNEKENVADYLGYAMIEDKENGNSNLRQTELPENFNLPVEKFNEILVPFYEPTCVMMENKVYNLNGEMITARNIGLCNQIDYSSSISIPLKETGDVLNISLYIGTGGAVNYGYCLSTIGGEWNCRIIDLTSSGSAELDCSFYRDLTECQEDVRLYELLGVSKMISPGEREEEAKRLAEERGDTTLIERIEEDEENYPYYVLCRWADFFFSDNPQCYCQEVISQQDAVCPADVGDSKVLTQYGLNGAFEDKQECENQIDNIIKEEKYSDCFAKQRI